jgi:magnesium transporter
MNVIKSGNFTWIDFLDPQPSDITYLQENFNIHPLAVEELITPTYQPKAVQYENCLFLSIHTPLFDTALRTTYPGELDIILTKDYIITSHRHDIYQLRDFFVKLSKSKGSQRTYFAQTPAHLLHHIIELLLNSCFPKLHHISENLDYIETQVFSDHEKEMVLEISVVKRDILNFRRTLKPQRSILDSLSQKEQPFIPDELRVYFQDLIGTNIRIWNILESTKETIEALEATNNSLLSNKLNLTMKVLTIFSAVLLPITLYSNVMSMSTSIPLSNNPDGFWIHSGVMLVVALATIFVFRAKKWF